MNTKLIICTTWLGIFVPISLWAQQELDKAVIDKITSTDAWKQYSAPGCETNKRIISVDLIFDTLPVVTYNTAKATYVATSFDHNDYDFPNCTDHDQNITQNFKLSTTLKSLASIENTDVETDRIQTTFKEGIKVGDIGMDISMSDDYQTSMTIRRQKSDEKSTTYEDAKTIPFTVKANTYFIARLQAQKGILRVPFHAHFVVSGKFKMAYESHCSLSGGMFCNGPYCEVDVPIKWFLKPQDLTFNFDGYVQSENSSKLTALFDERKIDRAKDCIIHNQTATTTPNQLLSPNPKIKRGSGISILSPSKLVMLGGDPNIQAKPILIPKEEEKNYNFKALHEITF